MYSQAGHYCFVKKYQISYLQLGSMDFYPFWPYWTLFGAGELDPCLTVWSMAAAETMVIDMFDHGGDDIRVRCD